MSAQRRVACEHIWHAHRTAGDRLLAFLQGVHGTGPRLCAAAEVIAALNTAITQLHAELAACFTAHPQAKIRLSQPGIGMSLLPRMGRSDRPGGQLFQTWKLDTCPAGHPLFAVTFTRK